MKIHLWTLIVTLLCCSTLSVAQQSDDAVAAFAEHSIISRDVLVIPGDTFRTIAKRELGRAGLAQQLAEFNGLIEAAPLSAGQIVKIPIYAPARNDFGQVIFVKGSVMLERMLKQQATIDEVFQKAVQLSDYSNVELIPLSRNSEVYPGDLINTGNNGFTSIEFSSGTVINLQPNTEAKINRLNCLPADERCVIDIKTLRGKVTSNVHSKDEQSTDFRISTPYASAAVRGTVFDIQAQDNTLLVGVTEGDVTLFSNASNESVELGVGYGSIVQRGAPPIKPIALLSAPVFKRVPARIATGDSISWWPNTQASIYSALVSTDAAGSDMLLAMDTPNQQIGIETIPAGDYFLTLRAVDENGLRGFTSTSRITIADIDSGIDPVTTQVTKQGREYLVDIVNPPTTANGYEVQISANRSFDDPLSVDIAPSGTAVFRLDEDEVFTRARVLIDPFTVSAFGPVARSSR